MTEEFYEEGDESLKIAKGTPTNMCYLLRTNHAPLSGTQMTTENIPLETKTHFLYGDLKKVNNQFFVESLPMLGAGSYLQIRQDTKDRDTIDVEVILKKDSGNEHVKNFNWHHQPINNNPTYYTEFQIDSIFIQLAIGSGIPSKELLIAYKKNFSF